MIAFFPCIRFEAIIPLKFRGEAIDQKNWSQEKKLEYSIKLHNELAVFYERISQLTLICIRKNLRLIIENPYTQPHYLTTYWCIRPNLIDKDRTTRGDYYKKPTQYWFINCEPEHKFLWELTDNNMRGTIMNTQSQTDRSMIHPQYANRFIREFIIGETFEKEEQMTMI